MESPDATLNHSQWQHIAGFRQPAIKGGKLAACRCDVPQRRQAPEHGIWQFLKTNVSHCYCLRGTHRQEQARPLSRTMFPKLLFPLRVMPCDDGHCARATRAKVHVWLGNGEDTGQDGGVRRRERSGRTSPQDGIQIATF
jgi:hypothetical protein